jgi:hypothetical protein
MARLILAAFLLLSAQASKLDRLTVDPAKYQHLKFGSIGQNSVAYANDTLTFNVNSSASALVMALPSPRKISSIRFETQTFGGPPAKRAKKQAESEAGDDYCLRIGLLLKGNIPVIPFFAADWIKQLRDDLQISAEKMIMLVPSEAHQVGASWASPQSKDIELIAVNDYCPQKWLALEKSFSPPLEVVGIWLMADGDDMKLKFTTELRNLEIQ